MRKVWTWLALFAVVLVSRPITESAAAARNHHPSHKHAAIVQQNKEPALNESVLRAEVLLARDDAEAARLDADSESEVIVAAAPLDPLMLVEDELLLALPFAPRHADGDCVPPESERAG